jgi:hypothetical protein
MAKADFKQRHIIIFGSVIIFLSFILNGFIRAEADSTTVVHAPCNDAASTLGLRACSAYIPQLLKQISNNQSAAYPIPMPSPSSTPGPNQPGMMQMYASAYYQGIDLDVSPSPSPAPPGHMYPGNNFGPICELVPNNLNHNVAETSTQASINNPSSPSCGTPMMISAAYISCSAPTDDETALMSSLNVTPAQLDNMSPEEAQALLAKAAAAKPNVVSAAASSGKKICITLDASGKDVQGQLKGQNGSLERSYLRGTFLQALSYYTDQTINQLQCQHSLNVVGASCQKFANTVAGLTGSTQANMTAMQSMLTNQSVQKNLKDIDACNISSFPAPNPTATGVTDPAVLRQSAQLLCSARSALEAAYSNLVMCNIFSQAQNDYISKTGAPALQVNLLNQMNAALDPVCRPLCKNSKSVSGDLPVCLQACYNKNMPTYLAQQFQTFWPQPTPTSAGACVGASQ